MVIFIACNSTNKEYPLVEVISNYFDEEKDGIDLYLFTDKELDKQYKQKRNEKNNSYRDTLE